MDQVTLAHKLRRGITHAIDRFREEALFNAAESLGSMLWNGCHVLLFNRI